MTPLKITLAATATSALIPMLVGERFTSEEPAKLETTSFLIERQFEEAWLDSMKRVAFKVAELERYASTEPKPIIPERVTPDVPEKVSPIYIEEPAEQLVAKKKQEHQVEHRADACTKYGMRKVSIRGGKGWRCRD